MVEFLRIVLHMFAPKSDFWLPARGLASLAPNKFCHLTCFLRPDGNCSRVATEFGFVSLLRASTPRERKFSPFVGRPNCQRDWRLVLHAGNLQPASSTHRSRQFGCTRACAASSAPDLDRADRGTRQRPPAPQAR